MTSRDFCYWLQGYFEILDAAGSAEVAAPIPRGLTRQQVDVVQRHLALVFVHEIDPSAGPSEKQAALNAIHGSPSGGTKIRC